VTIQSELSGINDFPISGIPRVSRAQRKSQSWRFWLLYIQAILGSTRTQ